MKKKKLFNYKGGTIKVQWDAAAPAEPVEIMVYDTIGSDPWSDGGITAEDFRKALNEAPRDRELHVRVNSKGGDVHEGMAMRNALSEWPKKVMTTYDGIAASTSSWAFSPNRNGDEVRAHRSSQVFIHDALTFGFGNASDLRKAADQLETTSDQIAAMYADKTGKGVRTMRQHMKDETLLTGEEAEEMGLVDTLIDGKAIRNFKPSEFVQMQNQIKAFYNSVAGNGTGDTTKTKETSMKKKIIALLNKHGVTQLNGIELSKDMSDEQLNKLTEEQLETALDKIVNDAKATAKPDVKVDAKADTTTDEIKTLRADLAKVTESNNAAKKLRITNEIETLVKNDQLTEKEKTAALTRALADETYLNELQVRPSKRPGSDPLPAVSMIECVSDSFTDIQNHILDNGPRFNEKFFGKGATHNIKGNPLACKELASHSFSVANAIAKNKSKIITAWNSNAIDAALQRQVILQDMLEAYEIVIINLDIFSTVFSNLPLEGTDKVEVPYFPLQATASTSFVKGTGYTTSSDWTENSREVLIGGDGDSTTSGSNAAANTCKDRKYQMINFDSYDLRRQPYLNISKLFQQAGNKLAVDIFTDFIGKVITAASFGTSGIAMAPASFSADSVAKLREDCTGQMWPQMSRTLVVDHTYYTPLLQDPSFKAYLNYGSTDPIQQGRLNNVYGFENIVEVPNLISYGKANEFLAGWTNHKSAVLAAFANIVPSDAVRNLLVRFDIVTSAKSGISFAYRVFADAVKDRTFEVVESSYGGNKGVDKALRRLTTQ